MTIQVDNLHKSYGDFKALQGVTFKVARGELVALLGPSGGGKSTILRIIAGLERADAGSVMIEDERVDGLRAQERNVGFVFQHYALFRHMTVAENIAFGLRIQRAGSTLTKKRVNELLELLSLEPFRHRLPSELSGGQRQRVALARALAPQPHILLLDEPFAAVDARVRSDLRHWLRRLHDDMQVTSIFVTHDQEEAFTLAKRVIVVNRGKVEQAGTPLEIMDHPATEFVARFMGDVNVFDTISHGDKTFLGRSIALPIDPTPVGQALRLVIRAYDLKFYVQDPGVAVVRNVLPMGDRVRVEASIDDGPDIFAHFPRRSSLLRGIVPGCRIAVEVTTLRSYVVQN